MTNQTEGLAMIDSNNNSYGGVKKVLAYWPIILTALAITVTAAEANTRLDFLTDRVEYIWENGPPSQSVRLARIEEKQIRIEEKQKEMNETLIRIEDKIDEKYSVSSESRKKLKRL